MAAVARASLAKGVERQGGVVSGGGQLPQEIQLCGGAAGSSRRGASGGRRRGRGHLARCQNGPGDGRLRNG